MNPESFGKHFRDNISHATSPLVVSFSSGKGGVGKTSLIINTAHALARMGKKVMILDGDLGLANVDVMLGLTPEYTLEHVLSGEKSLEDIMVHGPDGIIILPASSGITSLTTLNESEKLFILNEFSRFNIPVDIMFVDVSAGIADNVVYFNMAAQHRVIILTPEPTSITDAYALIKILFKRYFPRNYFLLDYAYYLDHQQ
jgi:flagellar biosynthesis protein FlhG